MTLSVTDLFTPAPSGVTAGAAGALPPAGSWLSQLLANAVTLGLSTTAWQAGGIARTILAIVATVEAARDTLISSMAQGGFLASASSVTPDPATPSTWSGATWTPGYLDILADGVYNVQRTGAVYAAGSLTVTGDATAGTATFQPGTYHVASTVSPFRTYSNTAAFTVSPSSTQQVPCNADVIGTGSTSAPGTITQPVTSLVGVTVTNAASFVGFDAESNALLVARCRAKIQALSPNGPGGAYVYFALSAYTIRLAANGGTISPMTAPITRAVVVTNPATGQVDLYVANAAGQPGGVVSLAITNATNVAPIVITTGAPHPLNSGDMVTVSGVLGNLAANGTFKISKLSSTTFSLAASVGSGAYLSGGVVEGGDIGEVDVVIQSLCVPTSVTAVTHAAVAQNVAIVAYVYVPAAQAPIAAGLVQNQIAAYFAALPIGGLTDTSGAVAYTNAIPFDSVLGAIYQTPGLTVQQATLTINGGTLAYTPVGIYSVAVVSPVPATINVRGTLWPAPDCATLSMRSRRRGSRRALPRSTSTASAS